MRTITFSAGIPAPLNSKLLPALLIIKFIRDASPQADLNSRVYSGRYSSVRQALYSGVDFRATVDHPHSRPLCLLVLLLPDRAGLFVTSAPTRGDRGIFELSLPRTATNAPRVSALHARSIKLTRSRDAIAQTSPAIFTSQHVARMPKFASPVSFASCPDTAMISQT